MAEETQTPLWKSLTDEQKRQVLEAYDESEDESTLITLADLMAKYHS